MEAAPLINQSTIAPAHDSAAIQAAVQDLLAGARRGRTGPLGQLFEMLRAQLTMLAEEELPRDLRAKFGVSDIVQETALDMHRNFRAFRGTTAEECFAWIRTMLRNNVVDAIRRFEGSQKRDIAREQPLDKDACGDASLATVVRQPDGSAIRHEDAAAVAAALARLPDDHRRVIELRYWRGLAFAEIGEAMGRSADAARKLWYRALECLQAELETPAGPARATGTRPVRKPR
jgi:RNA polymerase sigma-70 factor (ECF subfamily)